MGWSFRIARIAGISIDVHFTFIFIVLLGAYQWGRQYGTSGAIFGAILILLLFVCVTLHELGHAFAALRFKIPVRQIVLLPLGGVALLEDSPEKPIQELIIAAAGPLVNVIIAIVLWFVSGSSLQMLDGRNLLPMNGDLGVNSMITWLIQANISLVIFNLLPAFPLDGGRIFRAFLALFMNFALATKIAVYVGQGLAMLVAGVGLLTGNILLILVAIFIFSGARQERKYVHVVEQNQQMQAQRVGELVATYPAQPEQ
jgi:Zn-dependent protease